MSISGRPKVKRPRQFRFFMSNYEWEMLGNIASFEDASAAEVLRTFIERRHDDIEAPGVHDLYGTADALDDLARRVRARAATAVDAAKRRQSRQAKGYE